MSFTRPQIFTAPGLLFILLLSPWLAAAAHAGVTVTDDAGQRIELDRPARRIVSLSPHVTELLFAAGAGDAVVGVTEFSDYPAAARSITRTGSGAGLDLEAIIALQPDLVVAWQSGNPAGQLEKLQALGLTVFLSEPRQLLDIPDTLLRLGRLAGTKQVASENADRFRHRYRQLQQRYAGRSVVNVFYQIWDQPLMTLNSEHIFSDVVRLCGGRNVFAGLSALAPQISIEAVLAVDPDVIIVAADAEDSPLLAAWQRWPSLSAVANGHVYAIGRDQLVRNTPRILEGAGQLCKILEGVRERR